MGHGSHGKTEAGGEGKGHGMGDGKEQERGESPPRLETGTERCVGTRATFSQVQSRVLAGAKLVKNSRERKQGEQQAALGWRSAVSPTVDETEIPGPPVRGGPG